MCDKSERRFGFMDKSEVINNIAQKSGLTKKASRKALDATLATIREAILNGENVKLIGFGTFKPSKRKERIGRNPRTGETVTIPEHNTVTFHVGSKLKEEVK